MANTTAWAAGVPKNTGEQITAAEFNALDDGQVAAITRGGTTTLTDDVVVDGGGVNFDFTDAVVRFGAINNVGYTSALAFTRMVHGAAISSTNFAFSLVSYMHAQTTSLATLVLPICETPDGATMTDVTVRLSVSGGGFSSLPSVMPSFKVYKLASGTLTSLGTATDSSANVGALNGAHSVTLSGLSEAIDQSGGTRYFVEITGAGGTNYVNGLSVVYVSAAFTTTKLKP